MKDFSKFTRKDFEALPEIGWDDQIEDFDSLIIMPTRRIHDSGYRAMYFIAVYSSMPKYKLSGCSDVLHLNGIGGLGDNWVVKYGRVPEKIPPVSWSIDCLKKSGLLRLFCGKKLNVSPALSSFEIFAKDKK